MISLGSRVRIIEADINGIVVDHTEFLDGTHRYSVQYWHEGKRETIGCEERELEVQAKKEKA